MKKWVTQKFNSAGVVGLLNWMPDRLYLKILYRLRIGKRLNLKHPTTFNEKLQWLKLYNRKPIYTTMVDKYQAKKYVADRVGGGYIIETYGVWDRFEDIDFDALPDQFVLKCTHDSGGLVICRDKSRLDLEQAKKKIQRSLKRNYYYGGREWPYKNVKPRILAEQYMEHRAGTRAEQKHPSSLPVYKFFCFGGEPAIVQVIQNDKQRDESIDYFDANWNLLELRQNFPNSRTPLPRPERFDEMLFLTRALAKDEEGFLRVDLYEINGKIYFSEFTFYSDNGMASFEPPEWDLKLGQMLKLPETKTRAK